MMLFVFSLGLPLLASVNPLTWSLVRRSYPDLRTLEAAETLDLGTRPVDGPVEPPAKAAPPWWMLRCWIDAPRSPDPAAAGVAACDLDDRYKRFDAAAEPRPTCGVCEWEGTIEYTERRPFFEKGPAARDRTPPRPPPSHGSPP